MFRAFITYSKKIFKPRNRYYATHTAVFKNGIRVAVEETISPIGCVSLFAQTGPRFETAENNGISHFIEHIACMGYECMDTQPLEDFLNSVGGRLTATTTREYQLFSGIVPAEYTLELINIMSLILTHPDLRDNNIEMEKQKILMELQDCERSPKLVVFDYLHQAAFQGTPLAQNVIGPIDNIKNFDENDVNSFFKQQYRPENLVLAVSGGVSHIEVISQAQKRLIHIACDKVRPANFNENRYTGSSLVYRDDSMAFSHVAIAVEAPGYGDPDFWPLFVASCISGDWHKSQGGGDSNAQFLAQAAASYSNECYEPFYIAYQDTGLWGVYYVAQRHNMDLLLHNIQWEWMRFCTNITAPEVERGINYAKFKLAKQAESSFNSCRDVGLQILYTCSSIPLSEKFKKLEDVTAKNIKDIGHKYIYDKCPVLAAIGPTECLPDYAGLRAGMYWLRF